MHDPWCSFVVVLPSMPGDSALAISQVIAVRVHLCDHWALVTETGSAVRLWSSKDVDHCDHRFTLQSCSDAVSSNVWKGSFGGTEQLKRFEQWTFAQGRKSNLKNLSWQVAGSCFGTPNEQSKQFHRQHPHIFVWRAAERQLCDARRSGGERRQKLYPAPSSRAWQMLPHAWPRQFFHCLAWTRLRCYFSMISGLILMYWRGAHPSTSSRRSTCPGDAATKAVPKPTYIAVK